MSAKRSSGKRITVADLCRAMDSIAPPALAQSWDNVGLLAGDMSARVSRALLCIDLTGPVVDEALACKAGFVMAYHPPVFKPISSLTMPSTGTDEAVFRCIRDRVAIYSTHTALDAADGGTNDVVARLCGLKQTEPIEYVDATGADGHKLVVFVPEAHVEKVADAVFNAGAGRIGDYSNCSFRLAGRGSFLGSDSTNPTVGRAGCLEYVDEIRLECVVREGDLPDVVGAMRSVHPYEEPAFDIYPLRPPPVRGIGRVGSLPKPISLDRLARKLKRATGAACVQVVGADDQVVTRAVIVVGAAGSLPFKLPLSTADVIITGEIRHHDALTILRTGCGAVALGHWASERPVLAPMEKRLVESLPGLKVRISEADIDPFKPV